MPLRRFGRTGSEMPILSLGGMRFQQSWKELKPDEITVDSQQLLENTIRKARDCGLNHIETARHYGSSELQLGWAFKTLPDSQILIQTKVPPREDPQEFESELEISFQKLGCQKVDLLAIHGLNLPAHLDQTDLRVAVGGPDCKQHYSASLLNISAMSYGSLSANAVLALNSGAKMGNFAHNTGEGGISKFHHQGGGDLIWQIGTG